MMEIDIYDELKDIKNDIKELTINISKNNIILEELVKQNKHQEKKLSSFSKFKSKVIAIFSTINFTTIVALSLLTILL
jgi:ABC-type siderophore export system fused ATPase/permease subunit